MTVRSAPYLICTQPYNPDAAPIAGDRTFVECRADFDLAPSEIAHRRGFYAVPFAGRQEFPRRR